jgi:hypothetical protein
MPLQILSRSPNLISGCLFAVGIRPPVGRTLDTHGHAAGEFAARKLSKYDLNVHHPNYIRIYALNGKILVLAQ